MAQAQMLIGILAIVFFLFTIEFIRKRHLREEYAILWLSMSLAIALLSLWPGLVALLSHLTGLFYVSAVVVIVFIFLISVLMHYSIVISRIKETNKELAQRYALLELRLKELERSREN
ncbi:MAG TPA: DUF2304 domain-containing protein [Syntrophorhabdales bacterium]|nr:DUF2304 domain-containing protein [Syntrophorhabdales bacterium]